MTIVYFLRQARNQGGGGGSNIFGMGKSRARLFMPSTIKEKFSSVAGADGAKEELQDIIDKEFKLKKSKCVKSQEGEKK